MGILHNVCYIMSHVYVAVIKKNVCVAVHISSLSMSMHMYAFPTILFLSIPGLCKICIIITEPLTTV